MRKACLSGVIALALALPGQAAWAEPISPEPELVEIAERAATQASPSKPSGLDRNRLVAVPQAGVSPELIVALVEGTATLYPAGQVELESNPGPGQRTHLTRIKVDSRIAPTVKTALADSGLFAAVDYEAKAVNNAYTDQPNDPAFNLTDGSGQSIGQKALQSYPGARFNETWPSLSQIGSADLAPVAVIDSGCGLSHPDRASNIVAGYDFGQGRADVSPTSRTNHDAWHGTAVASVIAAGTNNARGIAGAAWDNKVICYKAANASGELLISAVVDSMLDALAKGAKVINLSLSSPTYLDYFQWVVNQANAQGAVVVAAAGNNGDQDLGQGLNTVNYPAGYEGVIAVGSTDWTGKHSSFSNSNPLSRVALTAIGESVWAWDCPLTACDLYYPWSGTSFSAPLVAAAAALILRARPGLAPSAVRTILTSTARLLPGTGPSAANGAGALDAKAALDLALKSPTPAWFTPPHNGSFNVMPATHFALALGLGGNPMPTPSLAAGSLLPPGTALMQNRTVGWVLSGSIAKPGRYVMKVNASVGKNVIVTKQITLSVGGDGAFKAQAALVRPKINFLQSGQVRLTINVESGRPSGWYVATHIDSGAEVASGAWVGGSQLIRLSKMPMGRHRIRLTLHEPGWYGAKDWVGALAPALKLTVTKIKPTIKVKRKGRKLTVQVKAPIKARGKIKIKYGRDKLDRVRTVKLQRSRRTITMPQGRYKVKVTFLGNSSIAKRTTKTKAFRFR